MTDNKRIRFATKEELESFIDPEWELFSDTEKEIVKEQLLEVFYGREIKENISEKISDFVKRKIEFLNKSDNAQEPQPAYNNRITITTLAELDERTREHTRNMTPVQRLEYLQKLISITHGTDLSEKEKAFYTGKIRINEPE